MLLVADRKGYVPAHQEFAANLSDVKLLEPALMEWQQALGQLPEAIVGDRGVTPKAGQEPPLLSQIPKVALPSRGKNRRPQESQPWFKRLLKKRVIIEPIISHLKSDHRMNRCRYKGFAGDQINVAWAVMAWNTKKWIADTS
ncbi:MAG TPA: transposase [Oscillatoriaceae cyanobacterium M33_DOE_052]|nr:transposase [Oscillatoriaceae cyanobacterium M33_DOE_052]